MFTCADYAWNPRGYDPLRSIGQAIVHLEKSENGRALLADLVNAYPGMLIWGSGDTGLNPVRERWKQLSLIPENAVLRDAYIEHLKSIDGRFDHVFPSRYGREKKTLADDLAWIAANAK
jgi:hypothetical protein